MIRLFAIGTILSFLTYLALSAVLVVSALWLGNAGLGPVAETLMRIPAELQPYLPLAAAGLVAGRFGGRKAGTSAFLAVLAGEMCVFMATYGLSPEVLDSAGNIASLTTHPLAVALVAGVIARASVAKRTG